VAKRGGDRYVWTAEQLFTLGQRYANTSAEDLAVLLGLSADQVYRKANFLGLKKSQEYKDRLRQERCVKLTQAGMPHRRQKGSTPPNKGKKMPPGWSPGNMAISQFKKGNKPHTWVPIGSYRVNGDGYLEKKLTDIPGRSDLRWTPVHRLVWQEAHGPVPPDRVLVFKPGMKTTELEKITPAILELITRAELMKRNTIHNYPPELSDVMRARGILKRTITRKLKEQQS
jgi:hypothetical protein